jgi:50S ribosomal protein L16 3-hydroxylase
MITPISVIGNLNPEQFLAAYWQKKPLFVKGAFGEQLNFIDPDEVAGLSREEFVSSRLVYEKHKKKSWSVEDGPFSNETLEALPEAGWSLLVQDVDKILRPASSLFENFSFLPRWRFDDLMISVSPDKSSVGAHVDNYDVFLIQATGQKRWSIEATPQADPSYQEGPDLRILQSFSPTLEWLCEPGDMLYLPPGIAHHGVAVGNSMTFSVGFRALNHFDIARAFAPESASESLEELFYSDPDILSQSNWSEIRPRAIEKVCEIIALYSSNPVVKTQVISWMGEFLTHPKHNMSPEPPPAKLTIADLQSFDSLIKDEGSQLLFYKSNDGIDLFVNGFSIRLPTHLMGFIDVLTKSNELDTKTCSQWVESAEASAVLLDLLNKGILYPLGS